MDTQTKSSFCLQLADWAETAIERGRYPFRRVEVSPLLLTAGGQIAPDLVFWINRGSFMAGGFLLAPDQETAEVLEAGRQCAAALGVRHFVVWNPRAVHIWQENEEQLICRHRFPLPAGETQIADFQLILNKVLEELKLLAVLGAVPGEHLSAYYLGNLCHFTLQQAQPILADAFRVARGEQRITEDLLPEIWAERKSLLTLWRLLALISHDRLPMSIQPEGLERALYFALDGLPPGLTEVLRQPAEELPLPEEGAVLFHSLCRRLMQLPGCKEHERISQALALLLLAERTKLGGYPLPAFTCPGAPTLWLLYPDRPEAPAGDFVEIAPSSYLAGAALWRSLSRQRPPLTTTSDLFALQELPPPSSLRGTLCDSQPLATAARYHCNAMLRLSWPTRRFNLPIHTPRWMWETLHLLGRAAPQAAFDLQLPAVWLTADYGTSFFELLSGHFSLESIEGDPQGLLRMRFYKGDRSNLWTSVAGPFGTRQHPWTEMRDKPRALYLLQLALPDAIMALLDNQLLAIPSAIDPKSRAGAELFIRSSLGSWLWSLVSAGRPLPSSVALPGAMVRQGLACPSDQVLQALQRACQNDQTDGTPPVRQIDQELSRLLGPLPTIERNIVRRRPTPTRALCSEMQGSISEEIVREVFVDGIPRFPEQYLYNYYRPELQAFSFSGPLTIGDRFFGRITLFDNAGTTIEADTGLAMALQFASQTTPSPVSLPTDPRICAEITERYRSDLRQLRHELLRRTHLATPESRAADLLARRIWQKLTLPDWLLLDSDDLAC